MISRHPEHESIIKGAISDVRYEMQSLIKLLDNEPMSDVNRRLYIKCTHDVVDCLQVALNKLTKETDIDYIEDVESELN